VLASGWLWIAGLMWKVLAKRGGLGIGSSPGEALRQRLTRNTIPGGHASGHLECETVVFRTINCQMDDNRDEEYLLEGAHPPSNYCSIFHVAVTKIPPCGLQQHRAYQRIENRNPEQSKTGAGGQSQFHRKETSMEL